MSRVWLGVALLAALLTIVVLNLRGSRSTIQHHILDAKHGDHSELEHQVQLLRERVQVLEEQLSTTSRGSGKKQPILLTSSEGLDTRASFRIIKSSPPIVAKPVAKAAETSAQLPVTPTSEKARGSLSALSPLERPAPKRREGVVGPASYWSDVEVKTAGGWCRKPPPYAQAKQALVKVDTPTDKPKLTTELARKHASKDNMLIATYVNFNRLDFAFTFVKHLLALNNPHFIVGALDEKALRGLQEFSVPTFLIDSGLTTSDYGWGTQAFRKLGLHKVELVLSLAKTGVDCLTVDADAFILRDPFPYIRRYPEAEVLMSSDHLVATNGYQDDSLESTHGFGSAFNIGFIWIKASAVEFVQSWRDKCFSQPDMWDQVLFSIVLRRGSAGAAARNLQKMYKKQDGSHVLAGVLPVSLFASGHTFFVSRMAHLMHAHPYMVHTTFQYGGAQGKRHRLREAMMWEDPPEYYQANFLTFEPELPYALVYPRGGEVGGDGTQDFGNRMSVEQHFRLVHHQLTQIRNAFALAQRLNRILILPRLVCGLDRWWAPHSGIIPGSAARLPLLECPADHVIDVERMGKPETILREANMLCNPRTPSSVLQSIIAVDPSLMRDGKVVTVFANASYSDLDYARPLGQALVDRLRTLSEAKVLKLTYLPPDYRVIQTEREAAEFERKFKSYAGLWCCNHPPGGRGAGHIWYDFFHDVIPHKDRHNRNWDSQWVPKMGP